METIQFKPEEVKVEFKNVSFYYGKFKAIDNVSFQLPKNRVTAFIGPSGCGKSTVLRIINRTNEIALNTSLEGEVLIDGVNIYENGHDPVLLRKRVGMVFQKPNPFPKSVYENLALGPKIHGVKKKSELDDIVEESLKKAALWDEVKNNLHKSAIQLSGGQQQRLCIARALTIKPEVLLMDEPCSALDPISTQKIEDLIDALKKDYTIVIVTHNMQQAARVSDYTAFFLVEETGAPGRLVEFSDTPTIFTRPANKKTEDYITGRFG
ncbi:MAG: phosphate ABC transporter ATP-binding protein PstB [Actinomycetota bacterium]|nr:phosphate ABC transporter ATP-binding protein PstB [Actinomycetota bacterium]